MDRFKEIYNKIEDVIKKEWYSLKSNIKKIKEVGGAQFLKDSKIIIILGAISIIIISILFTNIFNDNRNDFIKGFEKALINNKVSSLNKYITVDNEKVNSNNLQSIADYFNGEEEKINSVIAELYSSGESGFFTLKVKDRLLGEKYTIDIEKVNLELNCEIDNVEIEIGNEKIVLNKNKSIDIIPGQYKLSYNHSTNYGDIEGEVNITIVEDESIIINLDANFVTLYSNFEDSIVYINNVETELLAKDIKNFGPIPKGEQITLHIERDFPWGRIKSEEISLSSENYLKLDINMVNDTLVEMVESVVDEFYYSAFQSLNNKNWDSIIGCTEEVKRDVYEYINEKTFLFSNNYEITDLDVEIEKSDFKYEDEKYKASVLTKVNYSIYKKILPFLKNEEEIYFFLSLEYDGSVFEINEIQKIEL